MFNTVGGFFPGSMTLKSIPGTTQMHHPGGQFSLDIYPIQCWLIVVMWELCRVECASLHYGDHREDVISGSGSMLSIGMLFCGHVFGEKSKEGYKRLCCSMGNCWWG